MPLLNCNTEGAANAQYLGASNVDGNPQAIGNDNNPDLFAQIINYDTPDATMPGNATPQYNCNISQIMWQVAGKEAQAYAFQYDNLDRLTEATYSDFHSYNTPINSLWSAPYTTDNKYKEKVTYDLRGNIQSLVRQGVIGESMTSAGMICRNYGIIDNLTYTYDPNSKNKLTTVTDAGDLTKGFKSVASGSVYTYDANGNLTSDLNKGITNIKYNYLNLPIEIVFTGNRSIKFVYDATGAKLQKVVNNNGATTNQYYVNGIEYKGTTLDRIPHTEGEIVSNGAGGYVYEYTLKDHLGNTRVTYGDANNDGVVGVTDIKQVNHYYPFGLNMEGNWNGAAGGNKYQYNGKEWNDDFGLGWNHHDWRFYDLAIGRFVTVDRLSEEGEQESISPYHFGYNNPIRYDDPDGQCPTCLVGALIGGAVEYGTQVASNYVQGNANPWTSNISVSAIVVAAGEGALTQGASAGRKIAVKVGAAIVNNTVDIKWGNEKGEGGWNTKVETKPGNIIKNASLDVATDGVISKSIVSPKNIKKAASSVGINNNNASKTVKSAIKGTTLQKTTSQTVKKSVKNVGNVAKESVVKTQESAAKAVTNGQKDKIKEKTNF